MGTPNEYGGVQVLMRFSTYHDKRRVSLSKSNLKDNPIRFLKLKI